jgi:hypothetical protein
LPVRVEKSVICSIRLEKALQQLKAIYRDITYHFGFWILDFGLRDAWWGMVSAIDLPNIQFELVSIAGLS